MAIFFHSNLSGDFLADYGWAFSQYLETIAIMSQLVLFVKKVPQSIIKGRINLNLHNSFHRFPSPLQSFIHSILAVVLCLVARWNRRFHKYIAIIRWLLVYDHTDRSFTVNGWFSVLLGKGDKERRRSKLAKQSLKKESDLWKHIFLILLSAREGIKVKNSPIRIGNK